MSLTADLLTLRNRFLAEWDEAAVLTLFEGEPEKKIPLETPYATFSITHDGFERMTRMTQRGTGRVWLSIKIPKGAGHKRAYEIAQDFAAIFDDWVGDKLRCARIGVTAYPAGSLDSNYFMLVASVSFISYHPD